ncbi:MAG: NAD(P)H-hydrate epimerase [Gammaproteobacteria bacterium]
MVTQILPTKLYTAADAALLDREAIRTLPIAGFTLMQRAAEAAWTVIQHEWTVLTRVVVLAGAGNNAGDGYALAALLHDADWDVQILALVNPNTLQGEAADALAGCRERGVRIVAFDPTVQTLPDADLYVDALLGVGLSRNVEGSFARAIEQLNATTAPVIALDIPSGLCADTGVPKGIAVRATVTVTFIVVKRGLLTADGPDYSGAVWFDDLRVPDELLRRCCTGVWRLTADTVAKPAVRRANSHKGCFGHVVVIGGDCGMSGALMLAAEAAVCAGAGRVTVVTRPEHVSAAVVRCPEAMSVPATCGQSLGSALSRGNVIVIGPGLGTGDWGCSLLQRVLEVVSVQAEWRVVLDADALNILAMGAVHWDADVAHRVILTPHPGEASRLLGNTAIQSKKAAVSSGDVSSEMVSSGAWSIQDVQNDRFAALQALVDRYGAHVILKGAGTLVGSAEQSLEQSIETSTHQVTGYFDGPAQVGVCDLGNPGMAVAGMGDVLSGVLGGLLAQGLSSASAAASGVVYHALAADAVWDRGAVVTVRPSAMMSAIQRVLAVRAP